MSNTAETVEQSDITINGIEMATLKATVSAIAKEPALGACHFRARNRWLGGNQNQSTVAGFYGARQEIPHAQPFVMHADEPPILAGSDAAANPVEHLLHALAACVTTGMVAHAAVRGIRIDALESEVEGDIDLNGFLGLDDSVPKGFTEIRVKFRVQTDEEDLQKLHELAAFSPVFNTITHGAQVDITLERQ